jgi:hypothetical protein
VLLGLFTQVPPDIVPPIQRPSVHIGRVYLRSRGQSLGQADRLISQISEPPGRVTQTETGESEQWASWHRPGAHLHAAALNELPVIVVERYADQGLRCSKLPRTITERTVQDLNHVVMGQRRRILESKMGMRHAVRLRAAKGQGERSLPQH